MRSLHQEQLAIAEEPPPPLPPSVPKPTDDDDDDVYGKAGPLVLAMEI